MLIGVRARGEVTDEQTQRPQIRRAVVLDAEALDLKRALH
jgi:hypothetical protein